MYNRTQNENGSFNTRCLDCFRTIASEIATENDLTALEANHLCPEKAMAHLVAQQQSAQAQPHLD